MEYINEYKYECDCMICSFYHGLLFMFLEDEI